MAAPEDFIDVIAPAVQEAAKRYPGVYASVGIAQAILESDWGRSELAAKTNNYFGVKWHGSPDGPFPGHVLGAYLHRTTERPDSGEYVTDALFRVYADARGSALDWADNLKAKRVYADAGAWTATSAEEFIRRIGPVYTGGDSSYSTKILDLMKRYDLRRFDSTEAPLRIIPRSEWGARPATNRSTVARSRRRSFVVHYDDATPTTRTGASMMKFLQDFHMKSRGWADIGYNFVIDQLGNIYEGRGWDILGAHAGATGNVEGIGVQIHIGGNQEPSPAALRALLWLKAEADRLMGKTLAWRQHGDYVPTTCAGGPLRAWLAAGRPMPGDAPAPYPIPRERRYFRPVASKHRVTAAYGIPGSWQAGHHTGIDFGAPVGAEVYAVAEGDVRDRGALMGPAYGIVVTINEDDDSGGAGAGSDWHYCHLSRSVVRPGQRVKAGDLIGYVGNTGRSTGPHLHLERRPRMGGYGTDLNPVLWDDSPTSTLAPASATPTPKENDPMPETREGLDVRFHHAGDSRWGLSMDHPVIGADVIGPIVYDIGAVVTGPEGAKVAARLAFLDRKTAKWVGASPIVPGVGNVVQLNKLGQTGHPECSIYVDVRSDVPGEVHIEQIAHFWR